MTLDILEVADLANKCIRRWCHCMFKAGTEWYYSSCEELWKSYITKDSNVWLRWLLVCCVC